MPTNGSIKYFDKELMRYREEILEKVNFSSTYTNFPWSLTVKEVLTFISFLYSIKDRKKRIEKMVLLFIKLYLFNSFFYFLKKEL